MIFAVCALFFHFANAPLLPLVGQKLALQFPREATAMLSFCMVAAQGVMLPIAILVGRNADRWGRRPIFLIAFAVLPIRAALYTLSDNAFWLLGVQFLDGVGAGIYEALTPLVIADIMRGTGRYNLAQGAVATTQGVGASISAAGGGRSDGPFRLFGLVPVSGGRRGGRLAVVPPVHAGNARRGRERTRACGSRGSRRSAGRMNSSTASPRSPSSSLTYVGVAAGRIPGLRLDRAGIAFLGGAAMIALGPLSLEEAFRAIDFNTIALLLGHDDRGRASQGFGRVPRARRRSRSSTRTAPFVLLVTVTVLAGVLSAFLVNDAICLVMTPIVMQVVRALGRNPVPYLVATATASNCGSVATITGNPQNMVIGAMSKISYPAFAAALAPVAAFGLVAVVVVVLARRTARNSPKGGASTPHLEARPHAHAARSSRRASSAPRSRSLSSPASPPAEGGGARRRDPPVHPPDQADADLPRDRRAAADPVRRPLHRRRGRGAGAPDAGPRSRWRRASASTFPGACRSSPRFCPTSSATCRRS